MRGAVSAVTARSTPLVRQTRSVDFDSVYAQGFARVAACTVPATVADPRANAAAVLEQARLCEADGVAVGAKVAIALRPEKLRIAAAVSGADDVNAVRGRVWDIGYLGDKSVYKIRLADGTQMKASVANVTRIVERPITWDDEVLLSWSPSAAVLLTR